MQDLTQAYNVYGQIAESTNNELILAMVGFSVLLITITAITQWFSYRNNKRRDLAEEKRDKSRDLAEEKRDAKYEANQKLLIDVMQNSNSATTGLTTAITSLETIIKSMYSNMDAMKHFDGKIAENTTKSIVLLQTVISDKKELEGILKNIYAELQRRPCQMSQMQKGEPKNG
ncbi:MAG: hypothetical protein FWG64_03185 [Firmicutes bacterium]|nr:hypothetical protein [Bacillota bacterium]